MLKTQNVDEFFEKNLGRMVCEAYDHDMIEDECITAKQLLRSFEDCGDGLLEFIARELAGEDTQSAAETVKRAMCIADEAAGVARELMQSYADNGGHSSDKVYNLELEFVDDIYGLCTVALTSEQCRKIWLAARLGELIEFEVPVAHRNTLTVARIAVTFPIGNHPRVELVIQADGGTTHFAAYADLPLGQLRMGACGMECRYILISQHKLTAGKIQED